ncbi:hypothetical protein ACFMQL_39455 [Nonomuraea fastidiosa]|uniref:hypothetical protein n=1 Tax=Nonomuraea fastidiosa TaxID=46173 RepID=UPI0036731F72
MRVHHGEPVRDERDTAYARRLDREAAAETAAVVTSSVAGGRAGSVAGGMASRVAGRRAPAPAVVAALLAGACGAVVAARLIRARMTRGAGVPAQGRRCLSTHDRVRHHER